MIQPDNFGEIQQKASIEDDDPKIACDLNGGKQEIDENTRLQLDDQNEFG